MGEGFAGAGTTAGWLDVGNLLITDPLIDVPLLITIPGQPPLAAIAAGLSCAERDCQVAECVCELSRRVNGLAGFRRRLASFASVAAMLALIIACRDGNGDGVPDVLEHLRRLLM